MPLSEMGKPVGEAGLGERSRIQPINVVSVVAVNILGEILNIDS